MEKQVINGLSSSAIHYLIHHVFLPPKLPSKDDSNPNHEAVLLGTTLEALREFKECVREDHHETIDSIIGMVTSMKAVSYAVDPHGFTNEWELLNTLKELPGRSGVVLLHVQAQNAGMMISKVDRFIHVEAFELSPRNEAVLATKGRLRRSFPGPALALTIDTFEQPELQATLAHTLAKMSHQPAVGMQPKARKAGQMHDENRDTTDPKLVTELFMGFLGPMGEAVEVLGLEKNTRDEVMYHKALLPWRRSPVWILLRVAMHLVFSRSTDSGTASADYYKTFMVCLMAKVLRMTLQLRIHGDLLYAMNAKLGRRLMKLKQPVPGAAIDLVRKTMKETADHLHARWKEVRQRASPHHDLSILRSLNFERDSSARLDGLAEFLNARFSEGSSTATDVFQPTAILVRYHADALPQPPCASEEYGLYNLKAFEAWVASHLPRWLEQHEDDPGTCGKLGGLIEAYHRTATPLYSGNPESHSILLLTILELWIACDRSAVRRCPLLTDYDPGLLSTWVQSLVLPSKYQMRRVLHAENYLQHRQRVARYASPSIFRDYGQSHCFAVKYFDQSTEHQNLRQYIESHATQMRDAKLDELREKQEEYRSLIQRHNQSTCDYHEVVVNAFYDIREPRHSSSCRKCSYQTQADGMQIEGHEWPLPQNDAEAKTTIFELKVPPFLARWRDTALFFLQEVLKAGSPSIHRPRSNHPLRTYQGLSSFFTVPYFGQRLLLLSENKPHGVTHRMRKYTAVTTEGDVCLNNGLRYQYFDGANGAFLDDFEWGHEIAHALTYRLPTSASSLQQFLFRPPNAPDGPSPNTVIASQFDCPHHMSLDEYKALCTIPLGCRIQWQNILLQLTAPSVDFRKVETTLVILQSIYQVGLAQDGIVSRVGHEVVGDQRFAGALSNSLREALQRIRENWESSRAVSAFISISARLLSLTTAEGIKNECFAYLHDTRAVTFGWMRLLMDKAYESHNDSHRTELLCHAVELALICADTFNVDDLDRVLSLADDQSIFIQCCIVIQNKASVTLRFSDPVTPILYQRWKSLSYRAYSLLARQILHVRSQCLDDAIRNVWSSYEAGNSWGAVSDEFDHWLSTTLLPESRDKPVTVHYNLLTGELLVNGLPLAHLPSEYTHHPTYHILFSSSDLEVMPTTVLGMQFSAKRNHAGYTVHLGIRSVLDGPSRGRPDLLVRALKDGQSYDLVPSRVLRGEFPTHFVDNFVHWYNAENEYVEFRPIKDPWDSSPDNWRLVRDQNHDKWLLVKAGLALISLKSITAREVGKILSPLESLLHLHAVFQSSLSTLEIELPRLSLAFSLKSRTSSLRSKQFPGLAVDQNQSLETLIGLQSKLMLRSDASGRRLLLLPEGRILCQKSGEHVHVTINHDTAAKAHAYSVDEPLRRLVDNGTLQSKLWLCYLHALTSSCLPDPLVLRTGTEEALCILRSAAVRSFARLAPENIDLLLQIADLTPGRRYYPANERVMQTVEWNSEISFLAQHGWFYRSVKLIFDQAEKMRVFYPESDAKPLILDHVESTLLDRDCVRSSTFRVSGFGAEDHTIEYDATYSSRDRAQYSPRGCHAFFISNFVFQGRPTLQARVASGLRERLWAFLAQNAPITGPAHLIPSSELQYDAGLLRDWCRIVSQQWCALHHTFSCTPNRVEKYRLMIWLSTLAFAEDSNMEVVQTLGSFFVLSLMKQIPPPEGPSFELSKGFTCHKDELRSDLRSALLPFDKCPEARTARGSRESKLEFTNRQKRQCQSKQDRVLNQIVQILGSQWPCETPQPPAGMEASTYLNMKDAMQIAKRKFKTWYNNHQFNAYLGRVEYALRGVRVARVEMPSLFFYCPRLTVARERTFISIDGIFSGSPPSLLSRGFEDLTNDLLMPSDSGKGDPRLAFLLEDIESRASSSFEKDYVQDLRLSLSSLKGRGKGYQLHPEGGTIERVLSEYRSFCEDHVQKVYASIVEAVTNVIGVTQDLSPGQRQTQDYRALLGYIGHFPRLSPLFLLQQLNRHRWPKITKDWRRCMVRYALALTELQRAERLVSVSHKRVDLVKELANTGHTNWDPFEYPESLLLEVESGFLIRDVQEDIARQMRDVTENATMQLNMGEGKSSVIIPAVAAALADGSRLIRVITAKPQAKQMFQMLVSKLGGLSDRRIHHMPFSRSLRLDEANAIMIRDMCRECMTNGGILLVQPEHILSFKLMGLECLISGQNAVGRSLLHTQDFFNTCSRDIVDESDENFHVKFELIYTMGTQQPIELSPRRWTCFQQVSDLVMTFAPELARKFHSSMEVYEGSAGTFPRTRILLDDGQRCLFDAIARHICESGLHGLPIARQPKDVREAVFRYLTEPVLSPYEISRVESQEPGGFWTETTSKTLLLLRGLFAGGILSFIFRQKRWRVQYGLDSSRRPPTQLAVPYRAKDSPTLRSEFSHPDVVIALTCLCHYYGGLDDEHLFRTFNHLLRSNQADLEYQEWVKHAPGLPTAFRQLSGVNLKDRLQCSEQVFPPLRHAKNVVDYFLTHLVFPTEMREFPHKLSTSGWDIGEVKRHPTSGFSGTNDSRMTLPLSVAHLDLQEQRHTNALVLEHLLRSENSVMPMTRYEKACVSTTEGLLAIVIAMEPPVQVILDVGAQILELSNVEVAREWLGRVQSRSQAQAVVFFDEDDELAVLDNKGRTEPLQTSPFADQLDVCLIYLDEAHTRGTDLRLPEYYRAAVTLGPNLTKDRLIQACMRMRKLGHGQSVVFCVPEEITRQLEARKKISDNTSIGVSDVLCWAMNETWIDIRRSMPLWAAQGRRHEHQNGLWTEAHLDAESPMSQDHARKFLENEIQALEHRYRPNATGSISSIYANQSVNLQRIADRCRRFDGLENHTASLREEQERELSPEIVQQREVQRPRPAEPAKHHIHPDLTAFVIDGILRNGSEAFRPAFQTLRQTSAAAHIDISQFPADVLVTVDFATTIQTSGRSSLLDAYQRPVQWILTNIGNTSDDIIKHLVIISPYEAQILQSDVRRSKRVALHLYAPRPNLGIRPLDGLDLYVVSGMATSPTLQPHFIIQLNLFAGQLYLDSFQEYVEVCTMLGLAWRKAEDGSTIAADGFIIRDGDGQVTPASSFKDSPVPFLRVLMTNIRKNCEEIDKTHIGAILGGRLLGLSDF
ncbi:hypothetical protein H2200_007901 [Cladophialophora chaetospira]|uniref:ubiquitinyl hydrolase 1 n=1 Tax=Cladophialophora chaetospira TaxID=386627 RepID=A0AA38X6M2_9EURO|nr:hypothetical protein H2200_007901 [Cladophialophora chaetospira]